MKCPKCGEELPLLSQVCPCCKTVIERADVPSAVDLTNAIDFEVRQAKKSVLKAKKIKPAYSKALYLIILAVAAGMVGVKTSSGLVWIITLVLAVLALFSFIKRKKSNSFEFTKLNFDSGVSLVERFYKGNSEMNRFVQEASRQMTEISNEIEIAKTKNGRQTLLVALAEIIVMSVLVALVPEGNPVNDQTDIPEDYDAKVEYYINSSDPTSAIDVYVKSEYNNEFIGADKRKTLCELLCNGGYADEAESYFKDRCAGYSGDLDCATVIVKYYIRKGEKDKASEFAVSCEGLMRYKSDEEKIKKLL